MEVETSKQIIYNGQLVVVRSLVDYLDKLIVIAIFTATLVFCFLLATLK